MATKSTLSKSQIDLAYQDRMNRLTERARTNLLAFTKYTKPDFHIGWHHRKLGQFLERFVNKEIRRGMVFMPPRHGKSEKASRRTPAYILGRNPDARIIGTSYGADLASSINRDVQRIIDDPRYKELFPGTRLSGENIRTISRGALRNNDVFEIVDRNGFYLSAGIGGGITGRGAEYLLIDDPIKNQQEADSPTYRDKLWDWYKSVAYTRLEKDGCILIILTRWHEDDLAGRLLELAKSDPSADQWDVLNFPAVREDESNPDDPRDIGEALWPEKYNKQRLNTIKATVGTRTWNALYQQKPSPAGGLVLKREWWKFYVERPTEFDEVVQAWDLTFKDKEKSDFAVGVVVGRLGANFYLLDLIRQRMAFTAQKSAILSMRGKWPEARAIYVEDAANGAAIVDTLKSSIAGLIPIPARGSKLARAEAISPLVESGNVYLPDPSTAPWVHDFIEEASAFPLAAHDDQVDALVHALTKLSERRSFDFEVVNLTGPSKWFR